VEAPGSGYEVVVGVDGSEGSKRALAWAVEEASIRSGCVRAIHVVEDLGWHLRTATSKAATEKQRAEARVLLTEVVSSLLGSSPAVPVETVALTGEVTPTLCEAASTADLLVLGSRGAGGFSGLLMGSVSEDCAIHSKGNVVIVPGSDDRARAAEEPSAPPPAPYGMVVGVDGSSGSHRALRWAFDESTLRRTSLTAVCAWHYPYTAVGFTAPSLAPFSADELERRAQEVLDESIATVLGEQGARVARQVATGSPAHALLHEANGAQMLVVGSRGRGGFAGLLLGSVSRQCATHACCPTAVVHDGAKAAESEQGAAHREQRAVAASP
jgi:nucleotide-binding universal stress UspA family protein